MVRLGAFLVSLFFNSSSSDDASTNISHSNIQSSLNLSAMPPNIRPATVDDSFDDCCDSLDYDIPRWRSDFGSRPGAYIRGWPSTGGLYYLRCDSVVELDFLGVDRFNNALPGVDQAEEDAHCMKMRKLGAVWFPNEQEYGEKMIEVQDPNEPVLLFGWPDAGGVWVLRSTYRNSKYEGLGRVAHASSMQERCDVMRTLGGVFYPDAQDCPDLKL